MVVNSLFLSVLYCIIEERIKGGFFIMSQVRIFALGGLDENGKNMYVVEINQSIFVIEAGLKYPEADQHGVNMIIPDFRYLVENKDRVKGIFITHGHDDVMSALPSLLKVANIPVYTTALTAMIIDAACKEAKVKGYKIHRIKRNSQLKVDGIQVRTFAMTQSIADGFGVAIESGEGYIVYASEFLVDYDIRNEAFSCDITKLAEIGKRGVFALLTESVGAVRKGYTSPHHRISDEIEGSFEDAKNERIIVTTYSQNMYRIIEIIELANKYKKKVVFYDQGVRDILKMAEKLGYYRIPTGLEIPRKQFNHTMRNVVVIVSGSGAKVFKMMNKIALKEDDVIELTQDDTVIIASPIVPGTEREAANMENEIYKETMKVKTLDHRSVLSMHASQEDLKMMVYLFKPKYYIPIKGEYRHLIANANIAFDMGFHANKIVLLDNGQVAKFEDGELTSTEEIMQLEQVLVDGNDSLDVTGMVLRDREILSTDGALVTGVVVNYATKEIIGGPDVQSRGVIYLKDADHIVKEVSKIIEDTIALSVAEKRYENASVRQEIRDKITKYVFKETGKRPMVLPAIIEIHTQE